MDPIIRGAPTVGQATKAAPNGTAADNSNPPGCPVGSPDAQQGSGPPAVLPEAAPAAIAYAKADPAQLVNLPETIKQHAPCCVWRAVPRPGSPKPAKVPYHPKTGKPAKPGDLSTFGTFADAVAALNCGGYHGIGIAVVGQLVAVDIDGCVDAAGNLSEMAQDITKTLDGYTELSPSGTGIRVLVLVPEGYSICKDNYYINNPGLHLEVYIGGVTTKYVTVTGNTLTPGVDLLERGDALTEVLNKYMVRDKPLASSPAPAPVQASTPPADPAALQAADQQLLDAIMQTQSGAKLTALLAGDMSSCGNDHRSADMTACNILAAHTSDPAQIDRIIRGSKLMRSKWGRRQSGSTYGAITIGKAIASAAKYRREHGEPTPEQLQSVFVQAGSQGTPSSQQVFPFVASTVAPIAQKPQPPKAISAKDLAALNLPRTVYLVDQLLPEGTTVFTGPSKIGKSWEVLELGLSIAAGRTHMGYGTTQCGVLYASLEDSLNRLQNRMAKVLDGRPVPDDFYFLTEAPSLDMGLLTMLDAQLNQHPAIKLIIIDTLQRIRGAAKRGESSYATDYREMCALKNWAMAHEVSLILVHHNRKMTDSDAFNMISGTNGIMGSADTIWVITKDKRMDDTATLHITGRDVSQQELVIQLDKNNFRWTCLGSADALKAQQDRSDYDNDDLRYTILTLINNSANYSWTGTASDIRDAGQANMLLMGMSPAKIGMRIAKMEENLKNLDGVYHVTARTNGTGGMKHTFYLKLQPGGDLGCDEDCMVPKPTDTPVE